jgi:Glycosyl hydrolase family 115
MRYMTIQNNLEFLRGIGEDSSRTRSNIVLMVSRWADVPITQHGDIFLSESGCIHGSPSVKYRGIFLNDEQPALQNWVFEKFTNGSVSPYTNSPFNHLFYEKL